MNVDPWILAFSAVTVIATIWLGFWSAKKSRTASDFFVAGRSVSVGWNASAISGEYLSAASFMGIAGMVMSSGYDALWYPVCYACGYLFLLLFIAGPLRRFGAYTIPDFAEGRFDSPVFRKIAVIFVLFIGFFYTMPQMKGAGTTLAYIFPGLPYWVGVALVGAVITLNVALGGMKGITLVQAFQYWAKMFAISVPIFVLMAVYGSYGKQVGLNGASNRSTTEVAPIRELPGITSLEALDEVFLSAVGRRVDRNRAEDPAAVTSLPALMKSLLQSQSLEDIRGRLQWFQLLKGGTNLLGYAATATPVMNGLVHYSTQTGQTVYVDEGVEGSGRRLSFDTRVEKTRAGAARMLANELQKNGLIILYLNPKEVVCLREEVFARVQASTATHAARQPLPAKAPSDEAWLNPFGPLTTKAAKAAAAALTNSPAKAIQLRPGLTPETKMTVNRSETNIGKALLMYSELTGRTLLPRHRSMLERVDGFFGGWLARQGWIKVTPRPDSGVFCHGDGLFSALEVKEHLEGLFTTNGIAVVAEGADALRTVTGVVGGDSTAAQRKAWLARYERPLALLYTYSLIIALVCGTAGLPHILVRFYTNPDGVAAKRTTMWVMILIGVFYLFPPVFGVMGRNLMPDLYNGLSGVKGTDGAVLKLPRILNGRAGPSSEAVGTPAAVMGEPVKVADRSPEPVPAKPRRIPWGSILSGITCAGAFAAFMSTFSGLLVSMTGALAHDVYGRILRPRSTPAQRMRMFRIGSVLIGGVAILLGTQVEKLEINFMVGQAFAIAAASYFPLLFVSVWWRGLTVKGAAAGMLTGGLLAVAAISLTSFTTLGWLKWDAFWAAHPLFRILCDQPAIWAVPLAITLMVVVSKLTRTEVPEDIRAKMLVLHAPEKLGLKQEYIQEHQHGH